jgi:hypothetical protein
MKRKEGTPMADITLDQMFALASRLPRAQRAELVARLVHDLAAEPAVQAPASGPSAMTPAQAYAVLADIRATLRALPRPRLTLGEQIERDRAECQSSIEGESHVHP